MILNFLPTKGPDAYSYYAYGYDGNKQKDVAVSGNWLSRRQLRGCTHDHARQWPPHSQGRRQALTGVYELSWISTAVATNAAAYITATVRTRLRQRRAFLPSQIRRDRLGLTAW